MTIDRVIAEDAPRQHALIALGQLRVAGVTDDQIESRLSSGRLLRIRPRVYSVPGRPADLRAGGVGCRAYRGTGRRRIARIGCGALGIAVRGARCPGAHHLSLPLDSSRGCAVASDHCLSSMRAHGAEAHSNDDRGTDAGRPLISSLGIPARTHDHDALRKGTLRLEDLRRCVAGLAPARGRRPKRIEAVLTRRLPGYEPGDSALEMRFVRALLAAGLTELVQQYRVRIGGRRYRIDLAYPDEKLAIELDGWDTHRMRSAFDEDRARANDLVVAGWHVLRFTSSMTNEQAVSTVRSALAALAQRPVA
jgi:very-short-patch-repair endonuclease